MQVRDGRDEEKVLKFVFGDHDDNDDGDDDDENLGLRLLSYQAGRQETESTSLRLVGYASLLSTTTDFR